MAESGQRNSMPELPEVELVRRQLRPHMEGARIVRVLTNRPDLRRAFPANFVAHLEGQTVRTLERRGKYLLADLSSDQVLVMHLGMSGSFRVDQDPSRDSPSATSESPRHDHVVFHMSSGAVITFNDPRRFGSMDLISRHLALERRGLGALGPEPLSAEFDGGVLAGKCRGKKTSLKAALLDQRVVAGIGNIYACEALHRAHLSPKRRASTIAFTTGAPRQSAHALARAIKKVLADAISGTTGDRFRVYDREGKRCVTLRTIPGHRGVTQSGRSTFWCPTCQK